MATVTELGYGQDIAGGPRKFTTSGLVQPSMAAAVFLVCCTSSLVCFFLYYCFALAVITMTMPNDGPANGRQPFSSNSGTDVICGCLPSLILCAT